MLNFKIEPYVRKQLLIAICLDVGHIVLGMTVAWSSPVIPKLLDLDQSPLPYVLTPTQVSWAATTFYLGSFAVLAVGYISNKIGRRGSLLIGNIISCVVLAFITWPVNLVMLYAGRVLMGFAMSFTAVNNMVYIGEIASPNIRGYIFTSTGVFHTFGVLLMNSVGPFVTYEVIGYIMFSLNALHFLGNFYIPESPVYYAIKDNEKAARDSLIRLGRTKDMEAELKTVMETVKEDRTKKLEWLEIFTIKSNRKALIITLLLFISQESNGIVAVILFALPIFQSAGTYIDASLASIIISFTSFAGTLVSPIFVERYGRKFLLIVSTSLCGTSMLLLGVYFYLKSINHPAVGTIGWLPLACMIVAIFAFSIGLNTIPNAITGEVYRSNVRSLGTSLSMVLGFLSGFVSSTCFGYIQVAVGIHVCFWLYAVVNALALLFTIFFVPETKGKSLVEIENKLARLKNFRWRRNSSTDISKSPAISSMDFLAVDNGC